MKVGRNDPCPCGSGKKYKKCCLKKEMEQKVKELREKRAKEEAEEEFWDNFKGASYTGKISILTDYLDSKNPDSTAVFEMATAVGEEGRKRGDYGTYADLVRLIEEKRPEIYREDRGFYSKYLIESMALKGDFTGLSEALEPFAEDPDEIDTFFRTIELLMYHNRTDVLVDVMERAYPKVMASEDVIPQGKGEFATLIGWFIIFSKIEELDMGGLYPLVSKYWDVSMEEFEEEVAPLVTGSSRNWRKEDFTVENPWASIENKLHSLTAEFMAELHKKGMGYPRALLARNTLMEYIFEEYHHPVGTAKAGPLLLPIKRSLDHHLAGLLNPINNLPHRVMALIEALPFYLEFLHSSGLIEKGEFEKSLESLRPLKEDVIRVFNSASDKGIAASIEEVWENFEGGNHGRRNNRHQDI
jgi:hypothetical protein